MVARLVTTYLPDVIFLQEAGFTRKWVGSDAQGRVVDTNAEIRDAWVLMLRQAGYEVVMPRYDENWMDLWKLSRWYGIRHRLESDW